MSAQQEHENTYLQEEPEEQNEEIQETNQNQPMHEEEAIEDDQIM